MSKFFSEVVFPPLPRVETTLPANRTEMEHRLVFEMVYCVRQGQCISMVDCIDCTSPTKKNIKELLETGIGCE